MNTIAIVLEPLKSYPFWQLLTKRNGYKFHGSMRASWLEHEGQFGWDSNMSLY